MLASAMEHGDEAARRWLLADLADADRRQGRWKDGLARAREAQRLAEERDEPARDLGLLAWLEGGLGYEADAEEHARMAVKLGEVFVLGRVRGLAALGALDLARGDAAAAHRHLGPATASFFEMGIGEPGWEPFLPDAVEAALGAGDRDAAEQVTAWLEERATSLDRPHPLRRRRTVPWAPAEREGGSRRQRSTQSAPPSLDTRTAHPATTSLGPISCTGRSAEGRGGSATHARPSTVPTRCSKGSEPCAGLPGRRRSPAGSVDAARPDGGLQKRNVVLLGLLQPAEVTGR